MSQYNDVFGPDLHLELETDIIPKSHCKMVIKAPFKILWSVMETLPLVNIFTTVWRRPVVGPLIATLYSVRYESKRLKTTKLTATSNCLHPWLSIFLFWNLQKKSTFLGKKKDIPLSAPGWENLPVKWGFLKLFYHRYGSEYWKYLSGGCRGLWIKSKWDLSTRWGDRPWFSTLGWAITAQHPAIWRRRLWMLTHQKATQTYSCSMVSRPAEIIDYARMEALE